MFGSVSDTMVRPSSPKVAFMLPPSTFQPLASAAAQPSEKSVLTGGLPMPMRYTEVVPEASSTAVMVATPGMPSNCSTVMFRPSVLEM